MNVIRLFGLAAGVATALTLTACVDAGEANRVLDAQGFTNIQVTGYDFFGCSKDDFNHTAFTATSPTGKPVKGVVCGGFLKGSTVRFY